jgi:hypothetical protein
VTAGVQRLEGANFSQGVGVVVHGQDPTGLLANLSNDGRGSLIRWNEEVGPDCSLNSGKREQAATASNGACLEVWILRISMIEVADEDLASFTSEAREVRRSK